MPKININKKIILACFAFVIAFNLIGYLTVRAGSTAVQFTADMIVSLTGISDGDLYVRTNSECAEINISGTNLTVTDIPDANNFILKTSSHNNALKLTPSGGVLDLTLDSGNISSGDITQWTLNASSRTAVAHIVGVAKANTRYTIKTDSVLFNTFQSSASKEISFIYNGSWSEKVFTIEEETAAEDIASSDNGDDSDNTAAMEEKTAIEDTTGDDDEYTADTEDLEVFSVKSTAIDTTITITWKTDYNAKGYVRYGTDKNLSEKKKEDKKKKEHQLTLKNLIPATQYYFRITEETDDEVIDRSRIHAIATLPSVKSDQSMEKLNIKVQDYDESKKQEEDKKEQTEEDKIKEEEKSARRSYEGESFTTKLFKKDSQKYIETVKFQIVDNNGHPISNLKVTLRSNPQTVQTDGQGLAIFQNVALGNHTLAFNYQNKNFKKKVAIGNNSDKEGITKVNVIIIKAVKDSLPGWVWGIMGCLIAVIVWLGIAYFRKRVKQP